VTPYLAHRFFNRPIALDPDYAHGILAALIKPEAAIVAEDNDYQECLYDLVDGVAIIPICGVLVHGHACWWAGETSYSSIEAALVAAIDDQMAKAIVLHICSPGGEVDGCFELADKIYEMRGDKPIVAICDPYAYSAAYALASAADMICIPRTGGAGSIGVVAVHMEMSKMLKECGIGVTVIQFGDQKTERGPFAPLSDGAEKRMQNDIDILGDMFVELVARNRGISTDAVRATKAGVFLGAAAVENEIADLVASPQEAFAELVQQVNS